MRTRRWIIAAVLCSMLVGCRSSDIAGNVIGGLFGGAGPGISDIARAGIGGALDSAQQQWTKFSPEQEYYLGRAVAAEAIANYGLDPNPIHQEYVRNVGAAIVNLSTRLKGTYGGYHFAVLDTDEENGISGPGGYVFVTRGALLRCRNEEELAGILCHELGHVSLLHGEKVIRESKAWAANASALIKVISTAAGGSDSGLSADITELLGNAADDLFRTLAEDGYGRELELEADREGTYLLYDVGYDAAAIAEYLKATEGREMKTWSTHPPATTRLRALEDVVETYGGPFDGGVGREARTKRYHLIIERARVFAAEAANPQPENGPEAPPAEDAAGENGFPEAEDGSEGDG